MPHPALSVRPASWTFPNISSIESRVVPDTVHLMVEVAGLCWRAPAFDVTRPAGIAPWRSAHRNDSYHRSRHSSASTSASARDAFIGIVHRIVDRRTIFLRQDIFLF